MGGNQHSLWEVNSDSTVPGTLQRPGVMTLVCRALNPLHVLEWQGRCIIREKAELLQENSIQGNA